MVHFRYVKVSEDQDNIQHWAEKNPIENPLNILSNTHKTCGKPTNTGVSTWWKYVQSRGSADQQRLGVLDFSLEDEDIATG